MTRRPNPYTDPQPVRMRISDVQPGMTYFRHYDNGNEVQRVRALSKPDPRSDEIVTLMSIDPRPRAMREWAKPVSTKELEIGDWFDPFSHYGFASRRVISFSGQDIVSRGIATVNPNFDCVNDISQHREFGFVYCVPAPILLDPELRKVRLGTAWNQWTLISDDDWRDLKAVVDMHLA